MKHIWKYILLLCLSLTIAPATQAQTPPEKYAEAYEFPLKVGSAVPSGAGTFDPKAAAVDAAGNIYVSGSASGAEEYTSQGVRIRSLGTSTRPDLRGAPGGIVIDPTGGVATPAGGRMYNPFGIALDVSGNIFLADSFTNYIQKFGSDASYIGGIPVVEPAALAGGQSPLLIGLATDSDGAIYATDGTSASVMKYDPTGIFSAAFGSPRSGMTERTLGHFAAPRFLAVDGSEVYITDSLNFRVQVMKTDGTFERAFGANGTGNGQFTMADGIAVDGRHNIYVADGTRVEKFAGDGTFLTAMSIPSQVSRDPGVNGRYHYSTTLRSILGIAVDKSGTVYVPDGNKRVVVFKPVH